MYECVYSYCQRVHQRNLVGRVPRFGQFEGDSVWNWVNFIAAALGAIGGPAAIYTIWKERPRKLLLHWEIESRPAFPSHRSSGAVDMEFEKREVGDPYHLTLYIRPGGRKDIRASDFDDHELTLDAGARVVGVIDQGTLDQGSVKVFEKSRSVKIAPQVLKTGELVSLVLLVQGKPDANFDAKLADVDVEKFDHTVATGSRLSRGRLTLITGFAALMLILSGVIGWNTARQADQTALQLNQLGSQVVHAVDGAQAALSTNPVDPAAAQRYLELLREASLTACTDTGGYRTSSQRYLDSILSGGLAKYNNPYFCPDTLDKSIFSGLSPSERSGNAGTTVTQTIETTLPSVTASTSPPPRP
jgi:hypothetical protein